MAQLSKEEALYLVNHIFLPPQLPKKSDYQPKHEEILLNNILESVESFQRLAPADQQNAVDAVATMLRGMRALHSCVGGVGYVMDHHALAETINGFDSPVCIPLYVHAQNACVLLTSKGHCVHVEGFEVSALNHHVISTKGRLRRRFPGVGVSLPLATFRDPEFLSSFASTVAKMSIQRATATQPQAKKAGQMHDEDRDTTHPKMVTEFLMSILMPLGEPADTVTIWKNTRDEVNYESARLPWRRSPIWMTIRVAMQLGFSRSGETTGRQRDFMYKEFMVYCMATVVSNTMGCGLPSDILYAMTAKIRRRLKKVEGTIGATTRDFAHEILRRADKLLEGRWNDIRKLDLVSLPLSEVTGLEIRKDTLFRIPSLDEFISSIGGRGVNAALNDFQPSPILVKHPKRDLPVIDGNGNPDELSFKLIAFESWVSTNLLAWRAANRSSPDTCERMKKTIETYHDIAQPQYALNPESHSLMVLVTLELWVACDEAAIVACPLLKDYDPGIPHELLQNLLLPFMSQMQRLHDVEEYLITRVRQSIYPPSEVFETFGRQDCFSVRWYQQSPEQQELKAEIAHQATKQREAKQAEFRDKKKQYDNLMALHSAADCNTVKQWSEYYKEYQEQHPWWCKKCSYLTKACSIEIDIHEWPLPSDVLEMQSTVFELRVPTAFGYWRDVTKFVVSSVMGSGYATETTARSMYTVDSYNGLKAYFKPYGGAQQRIVALSENKPHTATHRFHRGHMASLTEDDVLLANGLLYHYYDNVAACFIWSHTDSDMLLRRCTYQLPARSSSLQQFIARGPDHPDGPSANTVLASQSDCPDHMSIGEYKALCSLPLGIRIQWHNILVQLHSPAVDFKKLETSLFTLQCIHQSGPREAGSGMYRKGHEAVSDFRLVGRFVDGLYKTLEKIQGNWQASQALSTLVSLACRLHTLTSGIEQKVRCLEFLSKARAAGMQWLETLTGKVHASTIDKERTGLRKRAVVIALICSGSFFLDSAAIRALLSSTKEASIFLQCSIIIQEAHRSIQGWGEFAQLLWRRWEYLCYHGYQILAASIVDRRNPCLDHTIQQVWPAYQAVGLWKSVSSQYDHWLEIDATNPGAVSLLKVHFNLLSGELLVNGVPLSRLPSEYERHDMYHILFGSATLEVMPTAVPGMRFSSKRTFAGYVLHFGMSCQNDLLVRAVRGDQCFELVPRRLLQGYFPTLLIEDHVHWYDMGNDTLLFRNQKTPWESGSEDWTLSRTNPWGPRRLRVNDQCLIRLDSDSAKAFSRIFHSLEDPGYIHCAVNERTYTTEIVLPRLRLGFYTTPGSNEIRSRQYRGMFIDKNQQLGSLTGLLNKLILRGREEKPDQRVLIPFGSCSYSNSGAHVAVTVNKDSASKVYAYHIDQRLGRLVDDGSLLAKLWICYLHALTSFCLPDPLTSKTGTEQSLFILTSAAVKSFESLTRDQLDMLQKIERLAPRRSCYPEHERVMQIVEWLPSLSFLAQHGRFHSVVRGLLDKHVRSRLFYPDTYIEPPVLQGVDEELLARDSIRSSTFRVAEFGAEDFTIDHDSFYPARDEWRKSTPSDRVIAMTDIVHHGREAVHGFMPVHKAPYIWEYLELAQALVQNDRSPLLASEISYDARWLSGSANYISENWTKIHRALSEEKSKVDKARLTMWLATLAYGEDANMPILYTLASFRNVTSMRSIEAPTALLFQLSKGARLIHSQISSDVEGLCIRFWDSPEASYGRQRGESDHEYDRRRKHAFDTNLNKALAKFVETVTNQWPCSELDKSRVDVVAAHWSTYLDTLEAIKVVEPKLKSWSDNHHFRRYIDSLACKVPHSYTQLPSGAPSLSSTDWSVHRPRPFVGVGDLFTGLPPSIGCMQPSDSTSLLSREGNIAETSLCLTELITKLEGMGASGYRGHYVEKLKASQQALCNRPNPLQLRAPVTELRPILQAHQKDYASRVRKIYGTLLEAVGASQATAGAGIAQWPRLSPTLFLQQLVQKRWKKLSKAWKELLVSYALALSFLQQAERRLASCGNEVKLLQELSNIGHTNWDASKHPESLLIEIESNITIRDVQEQVAEQMRVTYAETNQVMQLNMGEGKSSVIIPMIAASLANGELLVRVIVGKPQAKQMHRVLVSKLGGLLGRPVYHLPFSRAVRLSESDIVSVQRLFEECIGEGGVLLVQPEHILSFELMTLERTIMGDIDVSGKMVPSLRFLDKCTRDVVDESDENLSVKFELIYTMGMQRPTCDSPNRWVCIQEVLRFFSRIAPAVHEELPMSVQISGPGPWGGFARTRILRQDAQNLILERLARCICEEGLTGFPISRQPASVRNAVYKYITQPDLTGADISDVEDSLFWSPLTSPTMFILRGLIAEGVLAFAFSQKRWRVDYGRVYDRIPPTRLAVPYRAKDNPSPRSEFSHPDIVIVLTVLTYYYGGLSDGELFRAFHHLCQSDQADIEYQTWVRDANNLPESFQQLDGINLDDSHQCVHNVFPHLRYGKATVDYFLAHVVFPKEMKEFPHKLSASGWNIGKLKSHPTTGFSGTKDAEPILPYSMKQLDLADQTHTDAMVLDYILRPENSLALINQNGELDATSGSGAERLLSMVTTMEPPVRVIIDVGAQILELNNLEMARAWLKLLPDDERTKAVVFFDDNDHMCVLDRNGMVEPLYTSHYFGQMDVCLVFLDEVHTRGTDLQLPVDYRAAVTLGANLTKDRLAQACMRMRGLGKGQSVIFCVPPDIETKIRTQQTTDSDAELTVANILEWAISETWRDASRSMPVWAMQGRRYQEHERLWAPFRGDGATHMLESDAKKFLEDEAQSLESRYRPYPEKAKVTAGIDGDNLDLIEQRCRDFGDMDHRPAALQEEQERELSPEIERERQVQKALPTEPLVHRIHPHIRAFASTGILPEGSPSCMPALAALSDTSAAVHLDLSKCPGRLLVSIDFAQSIDTTILRASYKSDCFQRSVQWILTGPYHPDSKSPIEHMIIISPYEAQGLMQTIKASQHATLHVYSPRPNLGYRSLDGLDLYTLPDRPPFQIPQLLVVELNLFAGQLYFSSFEEYDLVRRFLGIRKVGSGDENSELDKQKDGTCLFAKSPMKFFKVHLTKVRRNCETIDKTHMGSLLDERLLTREDFD